VLAALTCIERDGIEATGIREIAREAGVNSAAINYYFQSKDKLLAIALERSLEQLFERLQPAARPRACVRGLIKQLLG
jgi:AcrR family transcriptional regulator